eukprot:366437-Chlamydomonas_euryale.AAC.8
MCEAVTRDVRNSSLRGQLAGKVCMGPTVARSVSAFLAHVSVGPASHREARVTRNDAPPSQA